MENTFASVWAEPNPTTIPTPAPGGNAWPPPRHPDEDWSTYRARVTASTPASLRRSEAAPDPLADYFGLKRRGGE